MLDRLLLDRIFLDTSVFLYALGGESPHREPCARVLGAVGRGELDAVTSSEVLQEILHVRAHRVDRKDATTAVRAAAALVAEVLPVTGDDVLAACAVLGEHPRCSARNALHVAVMQASGIRTIVTVDLDFDGIAGVDRLDPREVP